MMSPQIVLFTLITRPSGFSIRTQASGRDLPLMLSASAEVPKLSKTVARHRRHPVVDARVKRRTPQIRPTQKYVAGGTAYWTAISTVKGALL